MLSYKFMHHCNNQQQNSGISDTPSIDTRKDMSSGVLFCIAFVVICAAMPGESFVLPGLIVLPVVPDGFPLPVLEGKKGRWSRERSITPVRMRMSDEAPFETERTAYYPVRMRMSDEAPFETERQTDYKPNGFRLMYPSR